MTTEKKPREPAEYRVETLSVDHDSKAAALSWLRKNPTTGLTRIVRVCWSGTPVVENRTVVRL